MLLYKRSSIKISWVMVQVGRGFLTKNVDTSMMEMLRSSSLLSPASSSPAGKSHEDAAVLVVLKFFNKRVNALFERRASSAVDRWSAQIAFPGGRFSPSDITLDRTACREFLEETGFDVCSRFELLGYLQPVHPGNQPEVTVYPFICVAEGELEFKPNQEVEELFWIPIQDMKYRYSEIRIADRIVRTRALVYNSKIVWGMTQRILESLIAILKIRIAE
jgi:8-oxo-dGTP pyrophosphatase MutT (NUDIX family)